MDGRLSGEAGDDQAPKRRRILGPNSTLSCPTELYVGDMWTQGDDNLVTCGAYFVIGCGDSLSYMSSVVVCVTSPPLSSCVGCVVRGESMDPRCGRVPLGPSSGLRCPPAQLRMATVATVVPGSRPSLFPHINV